MKKLLLAIFEGCFISIVLANQPSYDQISITPQTWEEVDLTYVNNIDGKEHTEHANLLRPNAWVKKNHLDKVGATVHLTREQLGIEADVKVMVIKPTILNYSNNSHENYKPIIATFVTHSNEVWNYIFKNQYGYTEVIPVSSNHPFYSDDRQAFIPIGQLRIGEHVKTKDKNKIVLISKHKRRQKTEVIYNFEVYQAHNYTLEKENIVVHNPIYNPQPNIDKPRGGTYFLNGDSYVEMLSGSTRINGELIQAPPEVIRFNQASITNGRINHKIPRIQIIDRQGKLRIDSHGTKYGLYQMFEDENKVISGKEFANLLKSYGISSNGQPIRLTACKAGCSRWGPAQELANELGVTIEAPTAAVNHIEGLLEEKYKIFQPQVGFSRTITSILRYRVFPIYNRLPFRKC